MPSGHMTGSKSRYINKERKSSLSMHCLPFGLFHLRVLIGRFSGRKREEEGEREKTLKFLVRVHFLSDWRYRSSRGQVGCIDGKNVAQPL